MIETAYTDGVSCFRFRIRSIRKNFAYIDTRVGEGFIRQRKIKWRAGMELIKKIIHMNRNKGNFTSQITVDEDFNFSENKPDMGRIVMEHSHGVLESVRGGEEQVEIKGYLEFEMLYLVEGSDVLESFQGSIPFTETVNCSGVTSGDMVSAHLDVEDFAIHMVNSRKLRVNAVVLLCVEAKEIRDAFLATGIMEGAKDASVSQLQKELETMQLQVSRGDIYRVREEIELGNNKPNMKRILWKNLSLRGVEVKTSSEQVALRGELLLFLIYEGEEEHIPLQWMEKSIHFSGEIPVSGCTPELIPNVRVDIMSGEVEVRPDGDGEMRGLVVEAVLQLDMNLYAEESVTVLNDVYIPSAQVIPELEDAYFDRLIQKNNAKCKINDTISLGEGSKLLQICHSVGEVKLDRVTRTGDGLLFEGGIVLQLLYMSSDDTMPLRLHKTAIPFSYTMDVPGGTLGDSMPQFQVNPGLEQLSTVMLGNDEVEIRGIVSLDTIIWQSILESVMVSVKEEPLSLEVLEDMPGIVGYYVGEQDTLWSIAKQFYTSMESIKITNGLTGDVVRPGDRLLIVKEGMTL